MENSRLNAEQVTKAVNALLKYVENAKKSKKDQLIEESDTILLVVSLFKIPEKKVAPIQIPLSNPIYEEDLEICVFTKDPQKEFKEKFQQQNVKVAKIIGITKLKKNYKTFEARRQLCSSYDLFLADDRIIPMLPKALGNPFFKRKKQPIAIKINSNLQNQIESIRNSTFFFLSGTCCAVKVGKSNLTCEEIVENILQCSEHIASKIPKKWKNVQSINIKTTDSIALPIYNALPSATLKIVNEEEQLDVTMKEKEEENEGNNLTETNLEEEKEDPKKKRDGKKAVFMEKLKEINENEEKKKEKKVLIPKDKESNRIDEKKPSKEENKRKDVPNNLKGTKKRKKNEEPSKRNPKITKRK